MLRKVTYQVPIYTTYLQCILRYILRYILR